MSARVSPTAAIRSELDALFAEGRDLAEVVEDVARLGARLIIQTALEAEVEAFLGRARYQRTETAAASDRSTRAGHRNGYCPTTVKTTAGPVTVARPKLRGTDEAFASRLFGAGVVRSNALETLVIAGFVRGLSVRDVEAALAEALGKDASVSKSTVSKVCTAIRDQFEDFGRKDLSGIELDYLFLDASHFRMHPRADAEPVLAAWGITTAGKPVFIGLATAASESTDAWGDFLRDLLDRGLRPPLLVISDGGKGLIAAVDTVLHRSLRQRCLIHKLRNMLAKVSKDAQEDVKRDFWAMFDLDEHDQPGLKLAAKVQKRIDAFCDRWGRAFPNAVKCMREDREALTAYLRFPLEHHKRIRHSNFIERTFGETRRRVKVIGRFPGETSCVSLVFAVLDRAATGWRGFTMTATGLRLLQDLRRSLLEPPIQLHPRHTATSTSSASVTPATDAA